MKNMSFWTLKLDPLVRGYTDRFEVVLTAPMPVSTIKAKLCLVFGEERGKP